MHIFAFWFGHHKKTVFCLFLSSCFIIRSSINTAVRSMIVADCMTFLLGLMMIHIIIHFWGVTSLKTSCCSSAIPTVPNLEHKIDNNGEDEILICAFVMRMMRNFCWSLEDTLDADSNSGFFFESERRPKHEIVTPLTSFFCWGSSTWTC